MTTDILNLPKWDIVEVEEGHEEYVIWARYSVRPSACPHCGVMFPRLHRYGDTQEPQPYYDAPAHAKKMRLMVLRKKYKCLECGHYFLERLDDLDEHFRATKRLVQYINDQALERTFTDVAKEAGCTEGMIRHVFSQHVEALDETIKFNTPRMLGVDELHLLGQARCVLTNLEKGTLIDVLPGRKRPDVAKRLMTLPHRDQIEMVAMDMWTPYREAVKGVLPQATIVIDKFHVLRMATDGVDRVRKHVREGLTDRQRRTLMHDRFLLFRRAADLEPHKAMLLSTWMDQFPDLRAAYELKEDLYDYWDGLHTPDDARRYWAGWVKDATEKGVLWAFQDLTTAVFNWDAEIFSYFKYRITNATTEALNGVAKAVNRMGRGYSFKVIRAKMLYASRNLHPKENREGLLIVDELKRYTAEEAAAIREFLDGVDLNQLPCILVGADLDEQVSTKTRKKRVRARNEDSAK